MTKSAKAGAIIAFNYAKTHAPVGETGNLKKSIKLKLEKRKTGKRIYDIKLGDETGVKFSKEGKRSFYPVSQEYGWTDQYGNHHAGKRFMRNAIDKNRNTINQTILETMGKEIDKLR